MERINVVLTLDIYILEMARFESRLGYNINLAFFCLSVQIAEYFFEIDYDHLLPNPCLFIIHGFPPPIGCYITYTLGKRHSIN